MKNRIASLILAIVLTVLSATQALALEPGKTPGQALERGFEIEIETDAEPTPDAEPAEEPVPEAVFYLDDEPLYGVTVQNVNDTNYVTLNSILPLLDPTVVVEEANGCASVTAQTVAVVEPEADGAEAVVEVLDTLSMTAVEGQSYVVANNRYLYVEDGVATIDGAVAVPVRTLTKVLGMGLGYDKETGHIFFVSGEQPGYLADAAEFYNEDDLYWLSRIIHRESGNQVLDGKIAVGNVVLNRVNDPGFPSTIYDVIFQKNQFCNEESKLTGITPNNESVIAAMLALDGATALEGVLFFNRVGLKCFASKNRPFVATIGGHSFYA